MSGVDVYSALTAILRNAGYSWRREGSFIYVGTADDFKAGDLVNQRTATRLYRPNYTTAKELEQLITPLLTPEVGKIKSTSPAEQGIAPDSNAAGGDSYGGGEIVVVQDYESKLAHIDQIVAEVDRRPTQVAIEAMILSVKLSDKNSLGVDFELFRNKQNLRLVSGAPLASLAQLNLSDGGLKVGFLDGDVSAFIDALETLGDADIVATPRLTCLNRQRAEILIGSQLGYVSTTQTETATTQSVEFLEVGTQLRIRPFISSDGNIRLEVHPELSTGEVRVEQNFTLPDKEVTQVTTNVMVRDGSTVIIGGLIRDELTSTTNQIPLLGNLPLVGPVFRQKTEENERREILVLITPHIVYDSEMAYRGDKAAREFHQRHMNYADNMSVIGKRYLGRRYFHAAQQAWHAGDQQKALRLIDLSIHFDPLRRAAIELRSDIAAGNHYGDHADVSPERVGPGLHPLDGEVIAPWMIQDAAGGSLPDGALHPVDPGRPGPARTMPQPGMRSAGNRSSQTPPFQAGATDLGTPR
jgi:type IV pilus assembly protein PilQ